MCVCVCMYVYMYMYMYMYVYMSICILYTQLGSWLFPLCWFNLRYDSVSPVDMIRLYNDITKRVALQRLLSNRSEVGHKCLSNWAQKYDNAKVKVTPKAKITPKAIIKNMTASMFLWCMWTPFRCQLWILNLFFHLYWENHPYGSVGFVAHFTKCFLLVLQIGRMHFYFSNPSFTAVFTIKNMSTWENVCDDEQTYICIEHTCKLRMTTSKMSPTSFGRSVTKSYNRATLYPSNMLRDRILHKKVISGASFFIFIPLAAKIGIPWWVYVTVSSTWQCKIGYFDLIALCCHLPSQT